VSANAPSTAAVSGPGPLSVAALWRVSPASGPARRSPRSAARAVWTFAAFTAARATTTTATPRTATATTVGVKSATTASRSAAWLAANSSLVDALGRSSAAANTRSIRPVPPEVSRTTTATSPPTDCKTACTPASATNGGNTSPGRRRSSRRAAPIACSPSIVLPSARDA
jgi:hypothetical protein